MKNVIFTSFLFVLSLGSASLLIAQEVFPLQGPLILTTDDCLSDHPAADAMAFTGAELCGDAELIVEIAELSYGGRAGIVAREALTPDARMVGVFTDLSEELESVYRYTPGEDRMVEGLQRRDGRWLKLVRKGNYFTSYSSADGMVWRLVGRQRLPVNACLFYGVAAYSPDASRIITATFSEVRRSGFAVAPVEEVYPFDPSVEPRLDVFPNPCNGERFTADIYSPVSGEAMLRLFDAQGRLHWQRPVALIAGPNRELLTPGRLSPGMYFLTIEVEGQRLTQRLIVQPAKW